MYENGALYRKYVLMVEAELDKPEVRSEFDRQTSHLDKCAFMINHFANHGIKQDIDGWSIYSKDKAHAIKFREKGNQLFKEGEYDKSLREYNNSVMICPQTHQDGGRTELALSLANRAAALMKLKVYKLVVQDIELSIQYGYPKESMYKLYQRLGAAYEGLHNFAEGLKVCQELENLLKQANLDSQLRLKIIQENTARRKRLQLMELSQETCEKKNKNIFQMASSHPEFPGISGDVQLENDPNKGRCAVAIRNLPPGTVVARERALGSVLLLTKIYAKCWECLSDCELSPLPCAECPAVFCSPECLENTRLHRYECRILKSGLFSCLRVEESNEAAAFFLAFRLMIQERPQFHLSLEDDDLQHHDDPDVNRYVIFKRLLTHLDDVDEGSHLSKSLVLFYCLQSTEYLDSFSDENPKKSQASIEITEPSNGSIMNDRALTAKLLFILSGYLARIKSNCHSVMQSINKGEIQVDSEHMGIALYPSVAATINHSCDPNTFVINFGQEQISLTARTIEKGEEICQVYNGHFGDTSRQKRKEFLLKNYFFDCQCEACREDYPTSKELFETGKNYLETPNDQFKRPVTEKDRIDLDRQDRKIRADLQATIKAGDIEKYLDLAIQRIQLADNNLRRPHIFHLMGRLTMVKYMLTLHCNKIKLFRKKKLLLYY